MADHPHRRQNLLTGDWVLVSPHRSNRPWQGDAAPAEAGRAPAHDAACHLCAGNLRSTGQRNPDYRGTFVFDNDFPAMLPDGPAPVAEGPFVVAPAHGAARVICYGPDHGATLATMDAAGRRGVVDCWCAESAVLGERFAHVQIFENKGAMMGCSSPHPHGQAWATDFVPGEVVREDAAQRAWFGAGGEVLLDAVVAAELANGTRLVDSNDHWLAVVPHWASWPFEILLIARGDVTRLEALGDTARTALTDILGSVLRRYDGLFGVSFPYSMGWHGAPHGQGGDDAHWRLHAHFYPPLLRSASIRKFMVGYEMLAEAQRDLTPEAAAARLRAVVS